MSAIIALFLILGVGEAGTRDDQAAVRTLLDQQQRDWNRGDIDAFMGGYENSENLTFTSGGKIYRGWRSALERYRKNYPDRATMGQLVFSDLDIRILDKGSAVVLGLWAITRQSGHPHGVFTIVLRKRGGVWRIVHDHTSSSPD